MLDSPVSGFTSLRTICPKNLLPSVKVTSATCAGQNTPNPLTITTANRANTNDSIPANAAAVAQTSGSPRLQNRPLSPWERARVRAGCAESG